MKKLNLPDFDFTIIEKPSQKFEIFDEVRKKYVALTPEEWVRQNFIKYLINIKGYPASLIAIEKGLTVHKQPKRFDAVVYDKKAQPLMLLEFKAPEIGITQKVFEQISIYNQLLKVEYLLVSNGLKHYCCEISFEKEEIIFLKEVPEYNSLLK
jgi:hypothetical protein